MLISFENIIVYFLEAKNPVHSGSIRADRPPHALSLPCHNSPISWVLGGGANRVIKSEARKYNMWYTAGSQI